MGKSLIITEKPSVAREFATVLHVSGSQKGYIENQDYVITWCVGHLVGLVYPEDYDMRYKKWKLEDLPFLPRDYKYNVIKNVEDQYNVVHGMLQRQDIDRVYWAGDAGKEGQTIEENIRNFGGVRDGMEELRVWIDSQTEEEILRGIREARPMSDYANLGNSGIMRTIEDYAMGINFSRVMSVKYGKLLNDAAATKGYTAIAVGRVMTCVLGMVVEREREIRNFAETPFYRVIGHFSHADISAEWKAVEGSKYFESPLLYKENGFKKEESAQALMAELTGKPAHVLALEKGSSKKKAPLLFNLAELQAECAKRFKISPDETLQVAQDLYEKKLTTYPRTDARVLSTAIAKEISKNLNKLRNYDATKAYVETILEKGWYRNIANTQYTDDSKVTDHYAIIPTGQLTELNGLNSLQRAVYDMIVRRFLSIFYPAAEYETVKMTVGVEKEQFFTSAKALKSQGYLEVANVPKKKSFEEENARILGANAKSGDNDSADGESNGEGNGEEEIVVNAKALMDLANSLKVGDEISCSGYEMKYGKTNPPKRYTSGSMILAMENAGQLIEDEELRAQIKGTGIGTSATRAEIIAKLVRIGYLNLNKKSQILSPERLGEMVYEVVCLTVPSLLNPKMTANWEKGLDGITRGTVDFWDYRGKLEDFIRNETLKMIGEDLRQPIAERISNFAGKDAKGAGARRKIGAACPMCGGEIVTTPFGYGCSNYKQDKTGCNFNIGTICGVEIPEEQILKLLKDGRTDTIRGFKSRAGKVFDACLTMEKQEAVEANPFEGVEGKPARININFDFDHVEAKVVDGVSCPMCGGKITITPYGYSCENRRRPGQSASVGKADVAQSADAQNSGENAAPATECFFSIGEICGVKLSQTALKQLLTDGMTETIRGFKSKAGKKFDARLKLEIADVTGEDGSVSKRANVSFDFDQVEAKSIDDVKCPACGGKMIVTSFGYACENRRRSGQNGNAGATEGQDASGTRLAEQSAGCYFAIGSIGGVKLNATQVKQLLAEGKTDTIRGFKSKAGKKFDARLKLVQEPYIKRERVESEKSTQATSIGNSNEPLLDLFNQSASGDVNSQTSGFTDASVNDGSALDAAAVLNEETAAMNQELEAEAAPLRYNVVYDFDDVQPEIIKDVVCPLCGGNIRKLSFGYACVNNDRNNPESCKFVVGEIAGKALTVANLTQLLADGRTETMRGFKSKAGKKFDARLALDKDENGTFTGIKFDFDDVQAETLKGVTCPLCHGEIAITKFGYSCVNNKRDVEGACPFYIGKIASVMLSKKQVTELLTTKKLGTVSGFVGKNGMKFDAPLKLGEDGRVAFDFPERPKPVESNLECPKCHKKLMKGEWRYECECGFKVNHTVAHVPLTEEVMGQLLTDGKTAEKVTGFNGKNGLFDAYLKFEEDQIKFDFDRQDPNAGTSGATGGAPKSDAGKIDFASISLDDMSGIYAAQAEATPQSGEPETSTDSATSDVTTTDSASPDTDSNS